METQPAGGLPDPEDVVWPFPVIFFGTDILIWCLVGLSPNLLAKWHQDSSKRGSVAPTLQMSVLLPCWKERASEAADSLLFSEEPKAEKMMWECQGQWN